MRPRPTRRGARTLILLALALAAGCGRHAPEGTVRLTINGHAILCEVADNHAEHARGLSGRDTLGADRGMLFVYPDDRHLSFWMKGTTVPLSIAFIAADGRILNIERMAPRTLTPHRSAAPARYALEANQGWFAEHGIRAGERVSGLADAGR